MVNTGLSSDRHSHTQGTVLAARRETRKFFPHFCIIPTAKMFFWEEKSTVYKCVCVCVCVWERERERETERERACTRTCVFMWNPTRISFFCNKNIYCVYCTIFNTTCSLNSHHNSLKWNGDFLFNLSVLKKSPH